MTDLTIEHLMQHLAQERAMILGGAYDQLNALAQEKALLFEEVPQMRLTQIELGEIGAAAQRNHKLVEAALRGALDARRRIAEVRDLQSGFGTYLETGKRQTVVTSNPTFERKA